MKIITELFQAHPRENGVTYLQHMMISLNLCQTFAIASVQAFVHAVFPFVFQTTSSDTIKYLDDFMKKRKD